MEKLIKKSDLNKIGLSGKYGILYFKDGFIRIRIYTKKGSELFRPKLKIMKLVLKENLL
mgnify:CR=1 FL=1